MTVAWEPGVAVVTEPTETLAEVPSLPSAPRGKAKLKVAFCEFPVLVTVAA